MTKPVAYFQLEFFGGSPLHCQVGSQHKDEEGVFPLYDDSALQAAIAEYKQDAERYRWLKEYCTTESYDGDLGLKFRCDFENWNHIDAAIDAAMEKVK